MIQRKLFESDVGSDCKIHDLGIAQPPLNYILYSVLRFCRFTCTTPNWRIFLFKVNVGKFLPRVGSGLGKRGP